jgi:hypothetical protein
MFKYLARKIQPYLESDFLKESDTQMSSSFFFRPLLDSDAKHFKVKRSSLAKVCKFYEGNEDALRRILDMHYAEVDRIKREVANKHLTPEAAKMLDLGYFVKDESEDE